MKHSNELSLRNAITARHFAEQECPHWDMEGGPYNDLDCCYALREARIKVKSIRTSMAKEKASP